MTAVCDAVSVIDGRYRLGEVIGLGDCAAVQVGTDERLGREVAVKLFRGDPDVVAQGAAELELTAGLAHASLARVFDGGRALDDAGSEFTYLVMERVAGPTLRTALDRHTVGPDEAAAVGRELAQALAYLDTVGVVHGDLEPANVLVCPSGPVRAKLVDFGCARVSGAAHRPRSARSAATRVSPEERRGDTGGAAADIFRLATLLLELLGVPAEATRDAGPGAVPDTVDAGWAALLTAMLAEDPDSRPAAAEVFRALGDLETGTIDPAPWRAGQTYEPTAPATRGHRWRRR